MGEPTPTVSAPWAAPATVTISVVPCDSPVQQESRPPRPPPMARHNKQMRPCGCDGHRAGRLHAGAVATATPRNLEGKRVQLFRRREGGPAASPALPRPPPVSHTQTCTVRTLKILGQRRGVVPDTGHALDNGVHNNRRPAACTARAPLVGALVCPPAFRAGTAVPPARPLPEECGGGRVGPLALNGRRNTDGCRCVQQCGGGMSGMGVQQGDLWCRNGTLRKLGDVRRCFCGILCRSDRCRS